MHKGKLSVLLLVVLLALIPQLLWNNIDLTLFAFPINIALLIAIIGINFVLFREKNNTETLRFLASAKVSLFLFALSFVGSMVIALAPQFDFQHSWFFNWMLVLLLSNLQLAILYYKGKHRKRFYLNHVGLYIFIAALSFGAPDTQKARAILMEGQTTEYAYNHSGKLVPIGFPLKLDAFDVSYYSNGVPRSFKATVSSEKITKEILVNHPWSRSWCEDIYLVSHGIDAQTQQPYCVLEFIRQPWKYVAQFGLILTAIGAFLLLWGKKSKK